MVRAKSSVGCSSEGVRALNDAFFRVCETEPLRKTLREAGVSLDEGRASGPLSEEGVGRLEAAEAARAAAIAVDDFAPEEITGRLTRRRKTPAQEEAAE